MQLIRDAWVEINRQKLTGNYLAVKKAVAPHIKICAVLKDQCYGMDGPRIAMLFRELGAHMFAVATLSEALELRRAVSDRSILILGYLSPDLYPIAVEHDISLTIYRMDMLEALSREAVRQNRRAKIHIKVNTGMNRLGFLPTADNADLVARASRLPAIEIEGVFTHFAVADEPDKSPTRLQAGRFESFVGLLRERGVDCGLMHAANSPALCDLPEYDYDMVRPGLLLAGEYTSDAVSRERIRVTPCLRLIARLGSVSMIPAGNGVGYGYTRYLEKDTPVGLLPIGFSDGFTRSFSNHFYVMVRGKRCPVIGNICMDHCMIDLSEAPDAAVGDEIIVYGDGTDGAKTIDEIAKKRGTIVDEVLTNLSARLPRVFV